MKRKWLKFSALVALAALAAFLLNAFSPREPSYQGKRLRVWLEEDHPQARHGVRDYRGLNHQEETERAVQAMGEKAIPTLLQMLGAKDSALKLMFVKLTEKQSLVDIPYTLAETYQEWARAGFCALGPRAKGALPELRRLFYQTNSTSMAAVVLVAIGPESLPIFRDGLTNQVEEIRRASVWGVGGCGLSAVSEVPSLLGCLKDPSPSVRQIAAESLGRLGQNADRVLPALIESLEDPDRWVRIYALKALGSFRQQAVFAVPAIARAISNTSATDSSFLRVATNALKMIEDKPGK